MVQSPEMDSKHESRGHEFGRRQHFYAVAIVGVGVSTGSTTVACSRGVSREPGRACHLRYSIPVGGPVIKTQACPWRSARVVQGVLSVGGPPGTMQILRDDDVSL